MELVGFPLGSMKIIESLFLVEDGEPYEHRRSWKERLFSLPWRPLLKNRTVIPKIPMRKAIQIDDHTLVVHPVIANEIREAIPHARND